MHRIMVLVFVATVVTAEMDEAKKKCLRLRHPGIMDCCKSIHLSKQVIASEELKECMEIPHNMKSCERNLCFGKKKGFVSEDGTFDKEAFEKVFAEDFEAFPTLVEAVKKTCFKDNIADLDGSPEICDMLKIEHCIQKQGVNSCTEWDDDGPCAGTKDLVKECAKSDS